MTKLIELFDLPQIELQAKQSKPLLYFLEMMLWRIKRDMSGQLRYPLEERFSYSPHKSPCQLGSELSPSSSVRFKAPSCYPDCLA